MFFFLLFFAMFSSVGLGLMLASLRVFKVALDIGRRANRRRSLGPALQDAALRLGDGAGGASLFSAQLTGRHRGFRVAISDTPPLDAPEGLTFEITSDELLPTRMGIYDRTVDAEVPTYAGAVRVFDDVFDSIFHVRGRAADAVARLDAATRANLLKLASEGTLVAVGSVLRLTIPVTPTHADVVVDFIEQLTTAAASLFAVTSTTEARLLAMAQSESSVAIRYQLLDLLMRTFPGSPEANEALHLSRAAKERGLRYLAAIRDGDAGLPLIEEIIGASDEPVALREMALWHMGRFAPTERALPLLRGTLALAPQHLARVAVQLLGRLRDRESVESLIALVKSLEAADRPDLRSDVCEALGLIGDSAVEPALLELAERDMVLSVRIAAIEALGRAGGTTAIGPLMRLSRTYDPRKIGGVVRAAVARIEGRLGPRESGRLSLAPVDEARGALSLEAREGRLSFPDSPEKTTPRDKVE